MSDAANANANNIPKLIITPPEEGALAAWNIIAPLMNRLGIAHEDAPMDLAARVLTNGEAVDNAIRQVQNNGKAVYLKGPGITPSDKQMLDTIAKLESKGALQFTLNDKSAQQQLNDKAAALRTAHQPNLSSENMEAFARDVKAALKKIGSPNARWRDVLEVTLERGVSDALASRSTYKPAIWSKDTPFEALAMPADSHNTVDGKVAGGQMKIIYTAPDGETQEITEKLGEGSAVRLFTSNQEQVNKFIDDNAEKINAAQQIMHGSKATVIADYDVALNKMLSDKLHEMGASGKIAPYALEKDKAGNVATTKAGAPQLATGFLIDNAHAILADRQIKQPTLMIALNQSYGKTVAEFWNLVKEKGGFKAPENASIVRLSATKDHYKPFQFKGGKISIVDGTGKEIIAKDLKHDDALVTVLDRDRMKQSIKNVFEDAKASGKTVLFGFDDDAYYQTARDDVAEIAKSYSGVRYKVQKSSEAAAEYFTGGIKDVMLVCSNIMGDFYTDIELAGKGTSYSVGTLGDGRKAVELGTGGTAPDLLKKWKEEGILQFNPMAFVEGLSYGVKFLGDTTTAAALEKALYATTDNGIILPISKDAFTKKDGTNETKVSTHTFVKSVELETLRELKGKHPAATDTAIAKAEGELAKMIAYDNAVFTILSGGKAETWKSANKTYNDAREKAGAIDPFNPNYDLGLPLDKIKSEEITAEKLLEFVVSR